MWRGFLFAVEPVRIALNQCPSGGRSCPESLLAGLRRLTRLSSCSRVLAPPGGRVCLTTALHSDPSGFASCPHQLLLEFVHKYWEGTNRWSR